MAFSASRAALEGFRLVGRRPVSFVVWCLIYGAYCAALLYGVGRLTDLVAEFRAYMAASVRGPQYLLGPGMALLKTYLSAMLVWLPAGLALTAILENAFWRAILKPARPLLAYLRLGGAEVRTFLYFLLFAVGSLAWWACVVAGIVLLARSNLEIGVKVSVSVLACVAALAAWIYIGVRLALVGPQIVAKGRIDLGGAWRLSRGRFWKLFGMMLLAYVLTMAVGTLVQALVQPLMTLFISGVDTDFLETIRSSPALYAALAIGVVVCALLEVIIKSTPAAAAYRDISGDAGA